jgi:hypothetical protein
MMFQIIIATMDFQISLLIVDNHVVILYNLNFLFHVV